MAALVCILWQCSSEDFSLAEKNPKRNNSEFFKHSSGGLTNRGGVDYVSILEHYNEEHNFLATMPDQQGMPIWEKMRVLDSEKATGLIIPLSYDNETLSSVLFATLDDSNAVTGVKDYDNNLLEEIIYNQNLSKDFRQGILTSYFVTDHYTFDTTEFTNIPTDLFSGIKHGKDSIKLSFNGYVKEENSKSLGARLMISTTCLNIYHCKNSKPPSLCDGCSQCLTKTCETEYIFTDGDFPITPPGNPGGGGGTGTGTGSGPNNPGPQPPRDPCASATVFYRLMPSCGGGGGDVDLPVDPCANIITENTKAKNLLNIAVVNNQNTTMKTGISTSAIEKSFRFGKDASGNYQVSSILNGPASGGQVPMDATHPNFTVEGGVHNHSTRTYDVPSPGDIYWFNTVHTTNSHFNYYYTNGANTAAEYVYVITNPTDFTSFSTNFPQATYFDASPSVQNWNTNANIGKDYALAYNYLFTVLHKTDEEAMELAQAFVIGKYKFGIGISKKDSNGNFQPIFVEEISTNIPTGNPVIPFITIKTYQQTSTCNLK